MSAPAANWFLALPLPPQAGWHRAAADAPAALRRFDPLDLHITLAFLGPCGEAAALAAWRALAPLQHAPIQVTAGGWRAMGPAGRPSAYALSLGDGNEALVDLLTLWAGRGRLAAGCPPDLRPPLPHLTLLRPSRRQAEALRQPMAEWMAVAPRPAAMAHLDQLALYTWAEDRRQRLFRIVCSRPLASPT